jgi:hypothetical protein
MKSITRRNVVAVALRLLSVALLLGAVAVGGFLILDYASAVGSGGNISWGSFISLFSFFSVVPVFGAIAAWEAAGRVLAGGQASIE